MSAGSWIFLAVVVVLYIASFVLLHFNKKKLAREAVVEMTVSKFTKKVDSFIERNDLAGFQSFLKNHLFFVISHKDELQPYFDELNKRLETLNKK